VGQLNGGILPTNVVQGHSRINHQRLSTVCGVRHCPTTGDWHKATLRQGHRGESGGNGGATSITGTLWGKNYRHPGGGNGYPGVVHNGTMNWVIQFIHRGNVGMFTVGGLNKSNANNRTSECHCSWGWCGESHVLGPGTGAQGVGGTLGVHQRIIGFKKCTCSVLNRWGMCGVGNTTTQCVEQQHPWGIVWCVGPPTGKWGTEQSQQIG